MASEKTTKIRFISAKSEAKHVGDGGISNTVEVRGFSKNTSQDVLEMYFENSRRSGGGDVDEVQIVDGVACITFKEAEVAQRVVSHNHHQVDGQTLTVTLFHPLPPKPCYKNRVLIQVLNNAVTEELLRNFLETVTEAEVKEFLYGDEEGNVVVTLSDNIDFGQLRKIFQERRIEGAVLKVSRVAISNCIIVHNVQSSTTHDAVLLYFENKRSGGGDIERVEMKADEGYCLVYFEDHSVIDRVLSKSHNIDGTDVEVHIHHECLGRHSSRNKSDPYIRMPSPGNKDSEILAKENKENQLKDETSSSVSSNPDKESDFVEVQEWQENDGKNCTLPLWIKYKRAPEMKIMKCIKNVPCSWNFHVYWNFYTKIKQGQQILDEIVSKYNCSVAVCSDDEDLFIFEVTVKRFEQESDVIHYIHDVLDNIYKSAKQFLYFDTLLVEQRMQGDVLYLMKQRRELAGARIELMGQQDNDAMCVVCTEKDKMSVLHVVTEIIHNVRECFENHEETISVDHNWQKVMKTFGYIDKLSDKYPKVTITLNKNKPAIMLKGARDQSKSAILLKGPRDQSKAAADHLSELVRTVQSEVKEDIFSAGCQFDIFTYPEMCDYIDNIIMELSIVWIPNQLTKKIHIFSKKIDKLKSIDKTIKGCVQERVYPLSRDQSVHSHEMSSSLEELKKKYLGKIVINPSPTGLLVTTADDIFERVDAAMKEIISKQTGSPVGPKTPIQSSGARLKRKPSQETPDQRDSLTVYHDFKSFSRFSPDDRMEESTTSHPSDLQTFQHNVVTTSKTYNTREGITVKVYTGDIVRLPVDCIVNEANKNLSHGGGISLAIAKAAGREFDQESEEYVRRHGIIPVTECCVTSAGRLPYKKVIHVVGPHWHDYKPGEKDRCGDDLKKTIVNCLIQANSLTMTSIAIPSISSGIFGVPKALFAKMYVQGVIEFSRICNLKSDSVKEIHFVDMLPEMCHLTQLAFDAELNARSNKEPVVDTKQSQMKDSSPRRQELFPNKTQNKTLATVRPLSYAEAAAKDQGSKQTPYVFRSGDHTRILIYSHDITDVAVDGIVCPVFPNMESGVAKSVKRACGSEYVDRDYKRVMGSIKREAGETYVTNTPTSRPNLPFRHIIHVYSPCWVELEQHKHGKNLKKQIEKSVKNVFVQAIAYRLSSVALPVPGIGDKTTPVKNICEYMMDGIATVCSNPHMVPIRQMTIHLVTNETSLAHQLKEIACQRFGQKFDISGETLQNAYGYVILSEPAKQSHIKTAVMNDGAFSVTHRKPDPGNHLHGSKRAQKSQEVSCPVCLGTPVDPKPFNGCGHVFCRECMELTLENKPVCPACGKIYGIITGNQPKGTMKVTITSSFLPGFKNCGTIEILYSFPGGIQTEGHPNPGKPYQGTSMHAYLPDNIEGREVLSLLKKAFDRRLVFTIGRSVTTGAENTVTWNDIHHKINKDGGPRNYGYPDPNYLSRVREDLAAKGVTEDT